ncbi:unnamed protein product [Cladocopium goreaui]|uniref:Uncharacterized protein n=1 Tax=Cladocopium goreaui TaxID=2562237 RepID=A0A9P1DST5_9DINO|nr:unnamed protein product [Cladocopium goreaui]
MQVAVKFNDHKPHIQQHNTEFHEDHKHYSKPNFLKFSGFVGILRFDHQDVDQKQHNDYQQHHDQPDKRHKDNQYIHFGYHHGSSITATSSSTSITMTTTSLTETSSSSSMTSTSSSVTSTVTCGCCSSCLGWAMMIGCGSFDLCQRQLEECQAASLTCQGNLQGYQIGLEQCRNREAFLDATVASLTSQLSSQNCTGFVAEDDSETALWLLVILVVLLILALVLLLILCWRLRSKHQATKEQLAHCQDELFTRPQTSKQEKQEPGLQRQMRKLQRELDDANQKLAAKAAMEFKLQEMQERLGKEEENVRRGQELWKLNKSMYSILRQVVQDSRDFAQGVRDAGEKAPAVKQRIEQFEAKLAISSGRRDAAEAELAMLKNEGAGRGQPSEVDTTCVT